MTKKLKGIADIKRPKAKKLLREFGYAARCLGLEEEWGTGISVEIANKKYDKALHELVRYLNMIRGNK